MGETEGAAARVMRGHAFSSGLSVNAFALTHGSGFDPVGQVLGSCVYQLGYTVGTCGFSISAGRRTPTKGPVRVIELGNRRKALRSATQRALGRLAEQGRALGADGVVDVTLSWKPFPGLPNTLEVQARGTAVRARGAELAHLSSPFLCDLSGQDVAKLLHAGWCPTGVVVGICVAIRHDDYRTRQATRILAGNQEIVGITQLVNATRSRARLDAETDVAALGGTVLVVGAMSMRIWRQARTEQHHDHLAQATIVGTSIVRMGKRGQRHRPATPLPMLRLNGPAKGDPRRQAL